MGGAVEAGGAWGDEEIALDGEWRVNMFFSIFCITFFSSLYSLYVLFVLLYWSKSCFYTRFLYRYFSIVIPSTNSAEEEGGAVNLEQEEIAGESEAGGWGDEDVEIDIPETKDEAGGAE